MLLTAGFILTIVGAAVLWRGWCRRIGTAPHCRRCHFDLRTRTSERCPECGADLMRRRAVAIGRRRRGAGRVVVGIVLLVAGVSFTATTLSAQRDPAWWLEHAPAGWLTRVELPLSAPERQELIIGELLTRCRGGSLSPEDLRRAADQAFALLRGDEALDRAALVGLVITAEGAGVTTPAALRELFRRAHVADIDAYRAAFDRGQVSSTLATLAARASLERQAAADEVWEDAFGDPILMAWSIGALTDAEKVQFLHAAMPIRATLGSTTSSPDRISYTVRRTRGRAARRRMDVWPSVQFQPPVGVSESYRGLLTIDGTVHQTVFVTSEPTINRFHESSSSHSLGPRLASGWHDVSLDLDFAYHEQNADGTWRELAAWTEELEERIHIEGFAEYHDLPALQRTIREAITIEPVTIDDRESGGVGMTIIVHCALDDVRFRILGGPTDTTLDDDERRRWRSVEMRTSERRTPARRTYTYTVELSERLPASSLTIPFTCGDVEIDGTTLGRLRDPIEITIPLP